MRLLILKTGQTARINQAYENSDFEITAQIMSGESRKPHFIMTIKFNFSFNANVPL